jgi:hypothetical protein
MTRPAPRAGAVRWSTGGSVQFTHSRGNSFQTQHAFARRFRRPIFVFAGGYWYPAWGSYDDFGENWEDSQGAAPYYSSGPNAPYEAAYSADANAEESEIARLSSEVAQLQEQRTTPPTPCNCAHPKEQRSSNEKAVLIFRDKHQEEIENYAIVGKTLWILDQDRARKIPLAQIDIAATNQANANRGVDFAIPAPKPS